MKEVLSLKNCSSVTLNFKTGTHINRPRLVEDLVATFPHYADYVYGDFALHIDKDAVETLNAYIETGSDGHHSGINSVGQVFVHITPIDIKNNVYLINIPTEGLPRSKPVINRKGNWGFTISVGTLMRYSLSLIYYQGEETSSFVPGNFMWD